MSMLLTIKKDDREVLRVRSNGKARWVVTGNQMRWNKKKYSTTDDLKVIGEVMRQLGALTSMEVLRRAIDDYKD